MSRLWAVLIFIHVAHPIEESAVGRKVVGGWKMQLSVHCPFHHHLAVEIRDEPRGLCEAHLTLGGTFCTSVSRPFKFVCTHLIGSRL